MNTKQIIAAIGEQVKNLKQARNALLAYLHRGAESGSLVTVTLPPSSDKPG